MRWWDITGDVADERLEEEAEKHIRAMIAEDYSSGQLNHETDETSACGYWEVVRNLTAGS